MVSRGERPQQTLSVFAHDARGVGPRSCKDRGRYVSLRANRIGFAQHPRLAQRQVFWVLTDEIDHDRGALPLVSLPLRPVGHSLMGSTVERIERAALAKSRVERAAAIARRAGHARLAVISAVGTRAWYRNLGFTDGSLYQLTDT